jgi:uncharacterized membrane protein
MNLKNFFVLTSFAVIVMGCSSDNSDTLSNTPNPNTTVVTYKQNVKSIIDNNCISCHAAVPVNGAPMSLVTYDQVKSAVQNLGLISRISLSNGNSSLMPKGGPRLPQATIDVVVEWQQDGLLQE